MICYTDECMKSLQLTKPHLLIVVGLPGSGKTTFAERFSETFHAPLVNAGLIADYAYDPKSASWLVAEIMGQIQRTGQTLIYEPASGSRSERTEIAKSAQKAGYTPLIVWVQTDPYVAQTRLTKKSRQNPNPISSDEFIQQAKRFTAPSEQEKCVVISGMRTYATQAKVVLKKLSEQSGRTDTPSAPPRDARSDSSRGRRTVIVQ